jgi:hypothetical protein
MSFHSLGNVGAESQVVLRAVEAAGEVDKVDRSDDVTVTAMVEEAH